jgi:hypothetical protein
MAEEKKSFVLYSDLIHTVRKMPKEKQADLFMTILAYVNDENPVVDDLIVELVFEPIKLQMKRDLVKYENTKERRKEAGRLAGLKSGEARKTLEKSVNEPEPNEPNRTKRTSGSKNEPNEHVTVNDNVTVTVNDNVTDILLEKETKKEFNKILKSNNEIFGNEILESESWIETISMQNKIKPPEVKNWIESFNKKLLTELDNKISKKEYASHFSRWLPGEILKSKKIIQNGKQNFTAGTKTAYEFSVDRVIETYSGNSE